MQQETKAPEIHVGKVLYYEKVQRNVDTQIYELTVSKVGKKYFYTSNLGDRWPFDKKTLKYSNKSYSQFDIQLYRSKQEILDKRELAELKNLLYRTFSLIGARNFTLDQLRAAADALGLKLDNAKHG